MPAQTKKLENHAARKPNWAMGTKNRNDDRLASIAFDSSKGGCRYRVEITIALRATLRRVDLGVLDGPSINQLFKLADLNFADGDKMAPIE